MIPFRHRNPGPRSRLSLLAVAVVGASLAIGCGTAFGVADETDTQPTATSAKTKPKTKLTLRDSRYGKVLFDGKNRVLYLFTRDAKGPSRCFGACAIAWPPFMKRGRLVAGAGVDSSLLGSVKRGSRRQVTYAGKPLYYYVHDGPGQILCHNVFEFGGDWLVVQGSGEPAP